ncbi:SOS response-associated peptidase [Kordiimonas aestuarii]|uniref:SOS response-associated peptidase n=1 Tax=Kordiimonas aestuarii TaxID=1005925 RepID=UPI0021CF29BE|nr:SOS response-associated peptidase [Kordiimonas aestuarii]
MCGRYVFTTPNDAVERFFNVRADAPIPPNFNVAPTQPVLIIRLDEKGEREVAAVEWGLIPEWKKEPGDKPLINARIETVKEKPSFRSSVKRRRCLVPFSGWYEWKSVAGRKQPYYISPVSEEPMAFAGIWSVWHGPNGDFWLETMAILTAATEGPMSSLHHRRPLVVKPRDYEAWLTPHDPLPRGFLEGFDFMPETAFHWRPVSARVNNVRFNGPECLGAPEEETQPSLF